MEITTTTTTSSTSIPKYVVVNMSTKRKSVPGLPHRSSTRLRKIREEGDERLQAWKILKSAGDSDSDTQTDDKVAVAEGKIDANPTTKNYKVQENQMAHTPTTRRIMILCLQRGAIPLTQTLFSI